MAEADGRHELALAVAAGPRVAGHMWPAGGGPPHIYNVYEFDVFSARLRE